MSATDPVLERIARADPVSSTVPRTEEEVRQAERVLARAHARARAAHASRTRTQLTSRRRHGGRHRRPKSGVLIAVIIAAGVVAGGAAALNPFSATTGLQVRAGDRNAQAIGTGKVLALGASDEVSVGTKLTQDIHFAPGYESWRAGTIAFQTSLGPGTPRGHTFMTSSALRWQVAESAACSWLNYYAASRLAGDSTSASSAAAQIDAARSWPAITGLDYPDGLGSAVAAVNAGDAKLVQALIDTGQVGNCIAVGPFPPAGVSDAAVQAKLAAARQAGQKEIAGDAVARSLGITG